MERSRMNSSIPLLAMSAVVLWASALAAPAHAASDEQEAARSDEQEGARIEKLIDEACLLWGRGHVDADLIQRARTAQKELPGLGAEIVPYLIARIRKGETKVSAAFCCIVPTGVPELIELMQTDDEATTRARAAYVIGGLCGGGESIAGEEAHRALQQAALKDETSRVREQALWSLDSLRIKLGKDFLLAVLKDEAPEVRRAAVFRVGPSLDRADALAVIRMMAADSGAARARGGRVLAL